MSAIVITSLVKGICFTLGAFAGIVILLLFDLILYVVLQFVIDLYWDWKWWRKKRVKRCNNE